VTGSSGEERSVSWPEGRACDLAAQDRDLVPEHHDFGGKFLSVVPAQVEQLEQSNERIVEEGQRHDPSWLTALTVAKVQVNGSDGVLGTDTGDGRPPTG
jgi:hypothetical protein